MTLRVAVRVTRGGFSLDVDLSARPGRMLALLGPNGAGKTTTLLAIAGAIDYAGTVTLDERPLDVVPTERRRVGMVFQDYLLFPHLTVLENVAFGPRAAGVPRARARSAALDWLERFGVSELASSYPRAISGGQGQRVALARALAAEPEVLLLDEPLAALDVEVRAEVRESLAAHLASYGGVGILVSHTLDDARALAADAVVLEAGRVAQSGTVVEVLAAPATPWIARLAAG